MAVLSHFGWREASLLLFVGGFVLLLARLLTIGSRGKNYPPGPPTLPIIGNLHQMPKKDIHLQYQEWAKQYGPIFHLKQGSSDVVVLASGEMIRRLVDKRSANYADRPNSYMQELYEHSRIIMRGYDDLWKLERKLYHQVLNINIANKYIPYQDLETKKLLVDLIQNPEAYEDHIFRASTSVASSISYGFRIETRDNPVMKEMTSNAHAFFHLAHASKFLDWYPQLRPFVRFLPNFVFPMVRLARIHYHRERAQFYELYDKIRSSKEDQKSLPSFAKDIANAQNDWKGTAQGAMLTDRAASYIAGIAFEAGADTSANTTVAFVKAMLLFPEVQRQAQAEIDKVIGDDRLPQMDDWESLPYLRKVLKETLRWFPTGVNGAIPHASRARDEIDGYVIPAGANIVLAIWAANNDPELFPDPRKFDPGRQNPDLNVFESSTATDLSDHGMWSFGAGRRICPGMHVAERVLFQAMARMLWGFNITKAKDANGHEIDVDPEGMTQGLAARPLPFKCAFVPRNEEKKRIMEREWAKASEQLNEKGEYERSVI